MFMFWTYDLRFFKPLDFEGFPLLVGHWTFLIWHLRVVRAYLFWNSSHVLNNFKCCKDCNQLEFHTLLQDSTSLESKLGWLTNTVDKYPHYSIDFNDIPQLSNLWWMSNSVSKGFWPCTRYGVKTMSLIPWVSGKWK